MTLTVITELLIFNGQRLVSNIPIITQKIKFSIKDFFSKCYQIRSFLRIRSHLLKKSLMKNFIILCSDSFLPHLFYRTIITTPTTI